MPASTPAFDEYFRTPAWLSLPFKIRLALVHVWQSEQACAFNPSHGTADKRGKRR
jgi:hypothetical protein